jgi:hypothetical protein
MQRTNRSASAGYDHNMVIAREAAAEPRLWPG